MLRGLRGDAEAEGMRAKRPRMGDAAFGAAADEPLLTMDPSLMTERQQLAFLLRTTAQEASASESPHSEDDASGDDRRTHKKARRGPQRVPRSREGGRGRRARQGTGPRAVRTSPRTARTTLARPDEDENDAGAVNAAAGADKAVGTGHNLRRGPDKMAGPPRSSDMSLRTASGPFLTPEDAFGAGRTCALCGGAPSADALFLCPACDLKYPTQQALGRMCMT